MNNTLKIAAGAVVGAGIGWFIGAVIAEYIELIEEEKNNPYQIDESVDDEDDTEENQRPVEMSKNKQSKRTITVDYTKTYIPTEQDKIDINVLAAKYNQGILPPEESIDAEETWVDEDADTADSGPIRIINVSEFAASGEDHKKITLLYFDDDVVTDENRKILNDPEKMIGEEALISFGVLSDKEDTVYIRNDDRKTDFEVVRMDEPFITTPGPRTSSRFDHIQEDDNEGEGSD
jgi:hypothetical protein